MYKRQLIDLKLSRDEVTVTLLEEPSKGFFGIGSKLAKVRVEKKAPEVKEPAKDISKPKERKKNKEKKSQEIKRKEMLPNIALDNAEKESLPVVEKHEALTFLKELTEKMGLVLDITARAGELSLIHIFQIFFNIHLTTMRNKIKREQEEKRIRERLEKKNRK